jgi:uncharacterized protein (DUF427 family)
MPWLEILPPESPINLTYKISGNDENAIQFTWEKPKDELEQVKYYSIYKFNGSTPEFSSNSLVDIISSDDNTYTFPITKPQATKYYFAVKSVNQGWLESSRSTNVCEVIIPALYNFAKF